MTCIGEPISWLRLERHAREADPQVATHLDACGACRACLAEITGDAVALAPLAIAPPTARVRAWWWLAIPALAAAALAIVVLRPREASRDEVARIKGVGEVVLGTVRERAGAVQGDAGSFRPGDRWKVVVTCPPDAHATVDVAVVEAGATTADYPLAPAEIACGNRVALPGAFALTGARAHRICVRVASGAPPARSLPHPGDDGVACVAIRPE